MYIYLFIADYMYFKKHYEFIHSEKNEIRGNLVIVWTLIGGNLCTMYYVFTYEEETKLYHEKRDLYNV